MVKNKGFLPSGPSEIPVQRNQMKDIIYSLLPACKEADPDTKVPFKADAIIANPPAYGMTSLPLDVVLFALLLNLFLILKTQKEPEISSLGLKSSFFLAFIYL